MLNESFFSSRCVNRSQSQLWGLQGASDIEAQDKHTSACHNTVNQRWSLARLVNQIIFFCLEKPTVVRRKCYPKISFKSKDLGRERSACALKQADADENGGWADEIQQSIEFYLTPSNNKADDSNGEPSLILIELTLALRITSNSCQIAKKNPLW